MPKGSQGGPRIRCGPLRSGQPSQILIAYTDEHGSESQGSALMTESEQSADQFVDPLAMTPLRDRTVMATLDRAVRGNPHKVAVIDDDGNSLTYMELQQRSFQIATALAKLGTTRQQPVLVMLDQHSDSALVWAAVCGSSLVYVPINSAYRGEMLRHVIADSGAHTIIIEGEWCQRLWVIADQLPDLKSVIVYKGASAAIPNRFSRIEFDDLFTMGAERPDPPQVWDVAAIVYTSGTEGRSKGVLIPHGHAFQTACYPWTPTADDVVLVALPLFHAGGIWAGLYNAIRAGATAVVHQFSVSRFWETVRRHGCTTTGLIGSMASFLLAEPPDVDDARSPLRLASIIPAHPSVVAAFEDRFQVKVSTSYGATEGGAVMTTIPGQAHRFTCGMPRDFAEVRVFDEHGIDVPRGTVGEFVFRSREPWTMMSGYHGRPEVTVAAWSDLWFHSGDSGYQNQAGEFVYVDRLKDSLRRRGENISSYEVESHILEQPGVEDVAVVAVASAHSEDELKAVLILTPGADFDPVTTLKALAASMPYFMVPRYFEVVDQFPRTPSHKVQKEELRQVGVTERTWDCEAAGFKVTRSGLVEHGSDVDHNSPTG